MVEPRLLTLGVLLAAILHLCGCEDPGVLTPGKVPETPPCLFTPPENKLFHSSNFPHPYKSSTDCNYTLVAGPGKRVQLTIYHFETEQHPSCLYDKMVVWDSDLSTMRILCGKSNQNYVVTSTGPNMTLNFKTDSHSELSGWLATWNAVQATEEEKAGNQSEYAVTMPSTLVEENSEEICVELFDPARNEAVVSADLFVRTPADQESGTEFRDLKPLSSQTMNIGKADTRECFNLTIGSGQLKDVSNGIMNIKITDGAGYNVNVFRKVHLMAKQLHSLIQTDKGKYKPKDKVRFRILLVESDLLAADIASLDEVWVEDTQSTGPTVA